MNITMDHNGSQWIKNTAFPWLLKIRRKTGTALFASVTYKWIFPRFPVFVWLKMAKYIPPRNFNMVLDGVYRCIVPTDLNFPFLDRLHLRSIVYLSNKPMSDDLYRVYMTSNLIESCTAKIWALQFVNSKPMFRKNTLQRISMKQYEWIVKITSSWS